MGKGNGSQPLIDEEEDSEIWLSENDDEGSHDEGGRRGTSKDDGGRQGLSRGSGSEDEEVRRRSGLEAWSGREMPGRTSGVVEGFSEGFKTTVCVY